MNVVFALRHVQAVLLSEFLAYLSTSDAVVLVRDKMTVVVNAVEDKVTVGMLSVVVAHEDILRVLDMHPTHIVVSNLAHQIVVNLVNIFF